MNNNQYGNNNIPPIYPHPQYQQPMMPSGYGAPQPQYGQPMMPSGYGAPQPQYGQPMMPSGYGAPQPQYGQPVYPQPYGNPVQPTTPASGVMNDRAFCNEIHQVSQSESFRLSQANAERMVSEIVKKYNKTILSGGMGQNRIIVTGPTANTVYKIAYKYQGRQDNIGEFTISEFIRQNSVTDAMNRIAMTTQDIDPRVLYDGVIIVQEMVLSWTQKTQQEYGMTNLGLGALTSLFVDSPNSYRNGLKATIASLSKYFLMYDAHPSNPFNYGLKKGLDGQVYVCNLDYGYWIILSALRMNPNKANLAHPNGHMTCPKCGRGEMLYVVPESTGNAETDIKNLTSQTNPASQEYYKCNSCNESVHSLTLWGSINS